MKPDRLFLVVASVFCLTLLWFISGVWQSGGFTVVLGGAMVLSGCTVAASYGWRRPLFAFYLFVAMAAVVVGTLELYLRLVPGALSGSVANSAFGRYHAKRGGMYEPDPQLGVALKPNFTCNAYWQGHWWRHSTNAAGYRGPLVEQADAVFLGDSMIYGHGVDDDQTVSAHFGGSVANLGQQGTCAIRMAIRMHRTGVSLNPKVVFLCCLYNDVEDAIGVYDAKELQRYVATDPAALDFPTARSPRPRLTPRRMWDNHVAPSLCLSGAIVGLQHALKADSLTPCTVASDRFVPSAKAREAEFAPWSGTDMERLGWQANVHAIAQINAMCKRHGARFVLFDTGYSHAFSQAIEDHAKRMGIAYSPAGRVVLARALAGEEVYLPNDGHWTPLGNQIIAAELARAVVQ